MLRLNQWQVTPDTQEAQADRRDGEYLIRYRSYRDAELGIRLHLICNSEQERLCYPNIHLVSLI